MAEAEELEDVPRGPFDARRRQPAIGARPVPLNDATLGCAAEVITTTSSVDMRAESRDLAASSLDDSIRFAWVRTVEEAANTAATMRKNLTRLPRALHWLQPWSRHFVQGPSIAPAKRRYNAPTAPARS